MSDACEICKHLAEFFQWRDKHFLHVFRINYHLCNMLACVAVYMCICSIRSVTYTCFLKMVRTRVNGVKCVYFVQDKTVWLDENLFFILYEQNFIPLFNDEWKRKIVGFCVSWKYPNIFFNIFFIFLRVICINKFVCFCFFFGFFFRGNNIVLTELPLKKYW